MKSYVALFVVVAIGAASAASAQTGGINWDEKCHHMVEKFSNLVKHKTDHNINTVRNASAAFAKGIHSFVEAEKTKVTEFAQQAIQGLKLFEEVAYECYANASREILAAEQAAIVHLATCKNLTTAYADINKIADQAEIVVVDVIADARVIMHGVADCTPKVGILRWECVINYIGLEVKNVIAQWPEVSKFIKLVKNQGVDAKRQIEYCLDDPTQVSLDKKVKEAMDRFDTCWKNH